MHAYNAGGHFGIHDFRVAPLQNEIGPKYCFKCKTKSETKSSKKTQKNTPKRLQNIESHVQLPKNFAPALFHSFGPVISSKISNFLSQRESAGMATLT